MELSAIYIVLSLLAHQASSTALEDYYFRTTSSLLYAGPWGTWRGWEQCPNGGYAVSFSQKVERGQGGGDDTALNEVCLQCSTGGEVCSVHGPWGGWSQTDRCSAGYRGADFKIEGNQGDGDDTAANALELVCASGGSHFASNNAPWGSWLGYKYCSTGQVICGIDVKMEEPVGDGNDFDDTTLNGVDLMCCGKISGIRLELEQIYSQQPDNDCDPDQVKTTKSINVQYGLVSKSGPYGTRESKAVAAKAHSELNYSDIAEQLNLGEHNVGALSSALNERETARDTTVTFTANAFIEMHVYVAQVVLTMSDGSVLNYRGREIIKTWSIPTDTSISLL